MHSSVTFEEQWVRLMTHHTLVTRENIEEEWRSASHTGCGYLVSLFWSMIPSSREDTPDQFVQQLPLWCKRINDTQIRFHEAYRRLVQGTIESGTAFHAHGKTLKLESQRIGQVVRHLGKRAFERRWSALSQIPKGTPTSVKILWNARAAGFAYKRLARLNDHLKRETPLAALGKLVQGKAPQKKLQSWVMDVNRALRQDDSRLPVSLLHKVLADVVVHSGANNRGRALGHLYRKLQGVGLNVTALVDTEQEKWVAGLLEKSPKSIEVPCTKGESSKGKEPERDFEPLRCLMRTIQLSNELSEGLYETIAADVGLVGFDPTNPAKFLMRVVEMPKKRVQYIHPLGRFAVFTPLGKQAVSGNQEDETLLFLIAKYLFYNIVVPLS